MKLVVRTHIILFNRSHSIIGLLAYIEHYSVKKFIIFSVLHTYIHIYIYIYIYIYICYIYIYIYIYYIFIHIFILFLKDFITLCVMSQF